MRVGETPRTIRVKDEADKSHPKEEVIVDKILSAADVMKLANPDNPANPNNLDVSTSFEEEQNSAPKMSATDVLNMTKVNEDDTGIEELEEEEEHDPSTLKINPLEDERVLKSQATEKYVPTSGKEALYTKEEVEELVKSQAGAFWANYLMQIRGVKTNNQVRQNAVKELIEFAKTLLQTLKEGRF